MRYQHIADYLKLYEEQVGDGVKIGDKARMFGAIVTVVGFWEDKVLIDDEQEAVAHSLTLLAREEALIAKPDTVLYVKLLGIGLEPHQAIRYLTGGLGLELLEDGKMCGAGWPMDGSHECFLDPDGLQRVVASDDK